LKPPQFLPYIFEKCKNTIAFFKRDSSGSATLEYSARVKHRENVYRYQPKNYCGDMVLLVSEDMYDQYGTLGWEHIVIGNLDVRRVPGDHQSYIREHVRDTAAILRACLEES